MRLGGTLDFVASTATGGAVKIRTSDNFLTLVFGKTVADADNIADAYRRFAAKNVGVDDVLNQDQNAVMLWHNHLEPARPRPDQRLPQIAPSSARNRRNQ